MKFCFVHAADLHLDTPFTGIGKTSPETAAALRDASLAAFDSLVKLTIDRGAAFLLLAGDVYDGERRSVRAQLRFRKGLEQLSERGIATFMVHGNHDPLDGWSAIRHWPESVTIFGSEAVTSKTVTSKTATSNRGHQGGTPIATVHGISYGEPQVSENLAQRFERGAAPDSALGLQIGLLHCTVGGGSDEASYAPCDLADLKAAGMDYWALGHIHQRATLQEREPWVVYPGTPQGRSPKPSELGAKGAVVVEAADDGVSAVNFVPLDSIRFVNLQCKIDAIEDLVTLRDALLAQVEECRGENRGRGVIVRCRLTGRGTVFEDLARPGVVAELLKELREEAQTESPLVWWEGIRNETGKPLKRESLRKRGDFSSQLIQFTDDVTGDPERLQALFAEHLGLLERRSISKWLGELTDDGRVALLQAAEREALQLLDEESTS